jgi:opacity protein-like surface antigen
MRATAPSGVASSTAGENNAALETRIKELEAEIRTLRKKAASTKPAEPRPQNPAALTTPTASTSPYVTPTGGSAYPLAVKAPLAVRAFDWSGPYAGFSLGLGFLNASASTTSTFTNVDTNLPSPPGLRTTDTTISTASGKARHETGALADLYVGYNFRTAPGWVSGVQLEGSLGRFFARFNESGASTFTDVRSDVGLTNVQSSTFTAKDSLNITFMVSALARLGYLVTPRDLVYGLAGWSYAGFNTTLPNGLDPAFGANGITVGAGWERQILDTWTLKLEYRYTQFESITVPTFSSSSQTNFNNIAGLRMDRLLRRLLGRRRRHAQQRTDRVLEHPDLDPDGTAAGYLRPILREWHHRQRQPVPARWCRRSLRRIQSAVRHLGGGRSARRHRSTVQRAPLGSLPRPKTASTCLSPARRFR